MRRIKHFRRLLSNYTFKGTLKTVMTSLDYVPNLNGCIPIAAVSIITCNIPHFLLLHYILPTAPLVFFFFSYI